MNFWDLVMKKILVRILGRSDSTATFRLNIVRFRPENHIWILKILEFFAIFQKILILFFFFLDKITNFWDCVIKQFVVVILVLKMVPTKFWTILTNRKNICFQLFFVSYDGSYLSFHLSCQSNYQKTKDQVI